MQLEYEQSIDDYANCMFYFSWLSPKRKWHRLYSKCFYPTILTVIFAFILLYDHQLHSIGSVFAFLAVSSLFYVMMFLWMTKDRIKKDCYRVAVKNLKPDSNKSTINLDFRTDEFEANTKSSHTRDSWTVIKELIRTKDYFFLRKISGAVLCIPIRVFESDAMIHDFESLIEKATGKQIIRDIR